MWSFTKKNIGPQEYGLVTLYRPNSNFDTMSIQQVANLSCILSQRPVKSYGVILPEGVYLSASQYIRLPKDLQDMFSPVEEMIYHSK